MKKGKIRHKVNSLLLGMVFVTLFLSGSVSCYSLLRMKHISTENSMELGQRAAQDAEQALEDMTAGHLQKIAEEKAACIEEKFETVEAYVSGIVLQAADIYQHPEQYPDRAVCLPVQGSTKLASQLLWSKELISLDGQPYLTEEIRKLGNVQDLLLQYNANSEMVSSTYIATESGWMIQADGIAYSKYASGEDTLPLPYEAKERQWYQLAKEADPGDIVYTDVIRDIHQGGDCIVCASPVYVQGEVVAVAGAGSYLETVRHVVLQTTIGENGYAFLVNEKGQILLSGKADGETAPCAEEEKDLRKSSNLQFAEAIADMVEGQTDSVKLILDGREVYLAYAPLKNLGWSFATVIDVDEIIAPAKESQEVILAMAEEAAGKQDAAIRKMLAVFLLAMAIGTVIICLCGTLFSQKLTEPVRRLTQDVARIDGGNLDYRIQLRTGDEMEELGNAFNGMAAQLQRYVENLAGAIAEKERIRTEIEVASRVQADMLPKVEGVFADREEFSLAASMVPAKGVGGDFYDFFLLDEDRLALVIADVSGKGVPAALFMVVSRTLIRSHMERKLPLEQIVREINASLCANNPSEMFVTAWMGILTLSTGELTFVNAGHCHPLIRYGDGSCAYENSRGGLVLAGMGEADYRQAKIRLPPGTVLLLYTDGVTEATSREKELYGEGRLKKVAESDRGLSPEMLLRAIWQDVEKFQMGVQQFDDITLLAITYHGSSLAEKTARPDVKSIKAFGAFVEENLEKQKITRKTCLKILMAVDEIVSNICYYSSAEELTLRLWVEDRGENRVVTLCFMDDGIPYNPLKNPDPDVNQLLEKRKVGGLGIYLVKKQMDRMEYKYEDNKNCLTICKMDSLEKRTEEAAG